MNKDAIKRQFTVVTDMESELLLLQTQDINRMKLEFLEYYEQLIK